MCHPAPERHGECHADASAVPSVPATRCAIHRHGAPQLGDNPGCLCATRCRPSWEWHLPPIPGFPSHWRRHQFPGPGAVECRQMALAEGLAAGANGGYSAREWRVVPKRERRRDWWLTSDWRLPPIFVGSSAESVGENRPRSSDLGRNLGSSRGFGAGAIVISGFASRIWSGASRPVEAAGPVDAKERAHKVLAKPPRARFCTATTGSPVYLPRRRPPDPHSRAWLIPTIPTHRFCGGGYSLNELEEHEYEHQDLEGHGLGQLDTYERE